ncbi:hypothetical protein PFLUV_G00172080 [Perca fluviatilis]|uniref:Uncharacterized protein n=1 Tax=Perca fluviatilis TaxID=8168 RepID=A0A6A5DVQ1_PERFL|nr:hypothetical protein PFLUV_G00172080 [Perca fluviatilis]
MCVSLVCSYSFVLSTFGFTAVAFVTGSLALWAPTFLFRAAVFNGERAPCVEGNCAASDSLIFGAITVVTGLLGVTSGVLISRQLRDQGRRRPAGLYAAGLSSRLLSSTLACISSSQGQHQHHI